MFHQRTENKMHAPTENKVAPDSITIDGKKYDRGKYEDVDRPGFTRPGLLVTSTEIRVLASWGLKNPAGRPFSSLLPVERPPDPALVQRNDVPAPLREAASTAWARLDEVRGRAAAALEKRAEAEAARHRAFENRDVQGVTRAEAEYKLFEQQRRDLELQEPPLRRAVAEAEDAVRRWTWDEALRRQGRA
jgi:hypothetical protein